ncbi:MAG: hypothetical protein JXQ65_10165 [Candidatus Marinimicrobia bacterium]|nr:hypothetical protein [Candidatus Neomarinimicrobiota bacterium]
MKKKIFTIFLILFFANIECVAKNILVIVQIEYGASTFNNFKSVGWDANIDVRVFDQKFESDYSKSAPSEKNFKGVEGVIYIVNYPLGSQKFTDEMARLTMQTLHKINSFVELGGKAIIFMNNEPSLKNNSFKNYISDKFSLIHNTQWEWYGIEGSTILTFPFDGSFIHEELTGLSIGGCTSSNEIQGWYSSKPNTWHGSPIGNFTPKRYSTLTRKIGSGTIVFTIDCRYDSIFSDKYISTFDNYEAAVRLVKWLIR